MGELEGLPKQSAELEDMANKSKADKSELEHLFNLSVDMLCVANLDGYFTLINHAFEKTLGYTKEELLKEPFLSFVHPDDQASTVEAMKELSMGEPVIRFENRYQCKDGSYKWLAWSAMPVPEKGVIYAVAREVTGLKQVEQSLQESELWMKSIFNSLEEAVFVVTPDRKMVNVNDAAQRMFGYSLDDFKNRSTELVHVDHEHYVEFGKRIKEAFDMDKAANFKFECKRKNGEIFPTEHTVSLLKNDQGEPFGIVSVVRDNSERKRAEEALKQAHNKLERRVEERTTELMSVNRQLTLEIKERKKIEEELKQHREHLEEMVHDRTSELQSIVNAMADREIRMAGLKKTIKTLRAQLEEAGMTPVADDPISES